ncbi:hypothetical protein [Pseudoalteromonas phenolica]|uniref:hypothetical protein n=1 Tax=Pseudoalteromonas phenolica TaxID=161398 RepID=UPI00385102AA
MNAKDVFVDNMNTVIGKSKVKELVRQAGEQGIAIDYTYFMGVRRGERNLSTDKSEQITSVLRLLPGYDWIEHWMFFIPDYFKNNSINVLTQPKLTANDFPEMVDELLVLACRLKFLKLDETQFEQLQELAQYISEKQIPADDANQDEALSAGL